MSLEHLDEGRPGGHIDRNFAEYVWVPEDKKKPVARAAGKGGPIFLRSCCLLVVFDRDMARDRCDN
jgi:hypothetical protein